MKKKYVNAEMEIDLFEEEDIICTSKITDGPGDRDDDDTDL